MRTVFAYPVPTTSKLSGSEVPTVWGGTFEDPDADPVEGLVPDLGDAACSRVRVEHEWMPSREEALVPAELTAVCRGCPVRRECLAWAVEHRPRGYWAATTSADRRELVAAGGPVTTERADELQDEIFEETYPVPLHPGKGCRHRYAQGCRCAECRMDRGAYRKALRAGVPCWCGCDCSPQEETR